MFESFATTAANGTHTMAPDVANDILPPNLRLIVLRRTASAIIANVDIRIGEESSHDICRSVGLEINDSTHKKTCDDVHRVADPMLNRWFNEEIRYVFRRSIIIHNRLCHAMLNSQLDWTNFTSVVSQRSEILKRWCSIHNDHGTIHFFL